MIGLQFEVQRGWLQLTWTLRTVSRCTALCPESRIILSTPEGFSVPPGKAIRLINALQGSPQARRLWQDKAEQFLIVRLGFRQSSIDPAYYWRRHGECFTQILRTTDDFRISSDSKDMLREVSSQLMAEWNMSVQVNKT